MSWVVDNRFPQFDVDGTRFALIVQPDPDMGWMQAVCLYWSGTEWLGWGGAPDTSGYIDDNITQQKIKDKGGVREYLVWLSGEALRRAKLKAQIPPPTPGDQVGRMKYHLLKSVEWNGTSLVVPPAPLVP